MPAWSGQEVKASHEQRRAKETPFHCDLQPQIQDTHRTTHTASRTTSPPPFLTIPFLTTSLRLHLLPSSPLPFVTTSLPHHFPASPLPFVTTSLRHHFPSSPLPIVTTSHRRHLPSSPLPIVTTSHRHLSPFVTTLCHSFLFYVMYYPSSRSIP